MLYLTCTTTTSVDLAHYGVSRAKGWVSVDYGTIPSGASLVTEILIYQLNTNASHALKEITSLTKLTST